MVALEIGASQLGNQMFQYAIAKTLCCRKGYDFKYIRRPLSIGSVSCPNDSDKKYGWYFADIFDIPESERLNCPYEFKHIYNDDTRNKNILYEDIQDDTFLQEFCWSPQEFFENISNVRRWFDFPADIKSRVNKRLSEIKALYPDRMLVAVHFRVGNDFYNLGWILNFSYWKDAANYFLDKCSDSNPLFLIVYDKKMKYIEQFMELFESIDVRESLLEDMYIMTQCKGVIIDNSSFAIWGGGGIKSNSSKISSKTGTLSFWPN